MIHSENRKLALETESIRPLVLIRGAGDLATGIAICLKQARFRVLMTESAHPLAIRRAVSFAQAVYQGSQTVSGVQALLCHDPDAAQAAMAKGLIAVMVSPALQGLQALNAAALVDARMTKQAENYALDSWRFVVGIGPGFEVGLNCHVAVETNRGPALGKLLFHGSPQADTGLPSEVLGKTWERVYFAPKSGKFEALAAIGDLVEEGQAIGQVEGQPIHARFTGILRGILWSGLMVKEGQKLADIDPRLQQSLAFEPSDKALLIGSSVTTAILENTFADNPLGILHFLAGLQPGPAAVVGAGGKSTLLGFLAQHLASQTYLSTTTKLAAAQSALAERHFIMDKTEPLPLDEMAQQTGAILLTGPREKDKWTALQEPQLNALKEEAKRQEAWLILEADGSKGRPVKAPAAYEPAIPPWAAFCMVMAGLGAVGKALTEETAHRPQEFSQVAGLLPGAEISLDALICVMCSPCGGLKNIPPQSKRLALLNQADLCAEALTRRQEISAVLHQAGYDFVWIGSLKQNNPQEAP
ncbi:MAG: selenium-dependent molybdenum cofactor biosynthesis protein YqeB [Anaerolineaceae bacterium]|nr:selenium-dependent molybdenum cofactor biosynthesis protein YqeB [Anaerolineaceae bacterium]